LNFLTTASVGASNRGGTRESLAIDILGLALARRRVRRIRGAQHCNDTGNCTRDHTRGCNDNRHPDSIHNRRHLRSDRRRSRS
jgi:hypothetical protein